MTEVNLYKSRWKILKFMLLCSVFVIGGIFMVSQSESPRWIAWASIFFFGLSYPIGLYQLFDRRPQIIINEIGIFDRMTHNDFINWEIIQGAYAAEMHKQMFICLVVSQEFEPSRKKGKLGQAVAELNKGLGFQELNISLAHVTIDVERLLNFILAARVASRPDRELLIKQIAASL